MTGSTQAERTSYRLGTRVRTADRAHLETVLLDPSAPLRPTPAQFQAASREARIVSVHLDGDTPLHQLDRLPALWPAAWLAPL